jgi:GTP-binding protein HflX
MDLYVEKHFDQWLSEDVKEEILRDLRQRWEEATQNQCVFVSATERENLEALRNLILEKVRDMYGIRYPYKTMIY